MELEIYKSFSVLVYGCVDINVDNYVHWLNGEEPTKRNLKEYIENETDYDCLCDIHVRSVSDEFDTDVDMDESLSFSDYKEYKDVLNKAEEIQDNETGSL